MERLSKILFVAGLFLFLASSRVQQTAQAQIPHEPEVACSNGVQTSGALYQICMPTTWNGDLVVYAHGYVTPDAPLAIPAEAASIGNLATFLGYGFATTSYSVNGLAVLPALDDLTDLVALFTTTHDEPGKVYLIGPSEGGLITALSAEQHPDVYDGAMALCGPYGDFQAQVNYLGDFRVVFDYFFPGLMPGSPVDIPPSLMADWDNHYATVIEPVIGATLTTTPTLITQLMTVTGAPYTPGEPASQTQGTIEHLLWYNVFTVNNATDVLGGQPFDNMTRNYTGSADDPALNAEVARFAADPAAGDEIQAQYQTTGHFTIPVVTLHTTQDDIIPYFHVPLYQAKITHPSLYTHFPIERYGHCNFTDQETLTAFAALIDMVASPKILLYLPGVVR
ncbi:MAG: alpha/beta hydrolase [Anaerolineales bacterium]|nr:alpha/beta hydrolase [Anaerolineales bacterium]